MSDGIRKRPGQPVHVPIYGNELRDEEFQLAPDKPLSRHSYLIEWKSPKDKEPPDFSKTGLSLCGAWLYNGEVDFIDHVTYVNGVYWDQNTANMKMHAPDLYFVIPPIPGDVK